MEGTSSRPNITSDYKFLIETFAIVASVGIFGFEDAISWEDLSEGMRGVGSSGV
jgi:hypothetical protein